MAGEVIEEITRDIIQREWGYKWMAEGYMVNGRRSSDAGLASSVTTGLGAVLI